MLKPAVFIDRDGTLLDERGYLSDPRNIRFYKTAFGALKRLRLAGFRLVVLTNQSGIGRGYYSERQLGKVHARFRALLRRRGARVDGIYFCPHRPEAGCACRKPKTALARRAAKDLKLDLRRSFVVGDQARDVELARNLGVPGVLVLTGWGRSQRARASRTAAKVASNVGAAARWIIRSADISIR